MRTTLEAAYVLTVGAIATYGFAADSTAAILTAAALALPTSIVAVPGFYLAYGLLALVPGANPSSSSGSGGCTPGGVLPRVDVRRARTLVRGHHRRHRGAARSSGPRC